jgi:hypothetical protein
MTEHEVARLERRLDNGLVRIDACMRALHIILSALATGELNMSKIHDNVLALAQQINASADSIGNPVDTLIAAKSDGDAQLGDVEAVLQSASDKLGALQAKLASATVAPEPTVVTG